MANADQILNITDEQIRDHAQNLPKAMFQAIQRQCWETAEKSGWHGDETFGDKIALMHSELSEALEEFRDGCNFEKIYYRHSGDVLTDEPTRVEDGVLHMNKVEGIAAELADVLIRIFDDSERFGIPTIEAMFQKMLYNKTRPHRHGGKKI